MGSSESFQSWLNSLDRVGVSARQIYVTNRTGDVIHMGDEFLGVFGEIIRLVGDLHMRDNFHGSLRRDTRIVVLYDATTRKPLPMRVTVFLKAPFNTLPNSSNTGPDFIRDGILEDVRQIRNMVSEVLEKFPLSGGKTSPFWSLLQEPIYMPSPELSLNDAKKVALYNFSSPLFLSKDQLFNLIYKFHEVRKMNPGSFDGFISCEDNPPLADFGNWTERIPIDRRYDMFDTRQPQMRQLLFTKKTRRAPVKLPRFHDKDGSVVSYMRIANEHGRDIKPNLWSGKVFKEILQHLHDVLPKVHYMFCKLDDTDVRHHFGGYDVVKLLQSGPYGYKGYEVKP